MGNAALIKQRTGGKSLEDLAKLERVVMANEGWTMTQASWVAAGFTVDAAGYCQPAELFQKCLLFFNLKRRGSEAAFAADALSDHPRAKFRYGKAKKNPYEFGGAGVYPVGVSARTVPVPPRKAEPVVVEPVPVKTVDVGEMVAGLQDLLD